jgi:hypothetical protein
MSTPLPICPGQTFAHAVASVAGSMINTIFAHHINSSMTAGNSVAITYTAFNKPATITRGANQIGFAHGPEHQRFRQVAASGDGNGVLSERLIGSGGATQWTDYVFVAGRMIGMRVERSSGEVHTRYFHRDHLGSVAIITNETGGVVERLSYDAWASGGTRTARAILPGPSRARPAAEGTKWPW